ncbi:MAG: T9SS type A sorting domain-containing protein, partial [Bacteroidales bacterium]|nr:T9SS type A sorting domain-containing protein [Bacteroidales bacterium]
NEPQVVVKDCNQPPVANAGADQSVTDSDNSGSEQVTLDGSGSSDVDGTIVSYDWSENGALIATGVSPVVDLTVGIHAIILTVTDNNGAAGTDNITVVVSEGSTPSSIVYIENKKTGFRIRPKSNENNVIVQAPAEWNGNWMKWEVINTTGAYFRLKSVANNSYLSMPTTVDSDKVFGKSTVTQKEEWKKVNKGNGYFLLENRASGKRIRARALENMNTHPAGDYYVEVAPLAWEGGWVQWKFVNAPRSANNVDAQSLELTLYPNPTKSNVNVLINQDNAAFELVSTSGQITHSGVISNGAAEFDVTNLPAGLYFVVVETSKETIRKQLLIK